LPRLGGPAINKREERGVVIPLEGEGHGLEGLFISGEEDDAVGVVVAAPHPAYGGSMDSPVVHEVAYAARTAGLASLRFNWRGVGGSGGRASSEFADADTDYRAALTHLGESVPGVMVAAGYSFGALAALRCGVADPRVRALLLVAPPAAMLDVDLLNTFSGRVTLLAGDFDEIAPAAELKGIAAELPRVSCHVVDGADHFFAMGLADVGRLAAKSFERFGN
jgi:alpha/beta superfamily hydrolase